MSKDYKALYKAKCKEIDEIKNKCVVPNYEGMIEDYKFALKSRDELLEVLSKRIGWLYEHAPFWVRRKFLRVYPGAICTTAPIKENTITIKLPVKIKLV